MNTMKQHFLSIIAICVFCLTVLPAKADYLNGLSIQKENLSHNRTLIVGVTSADKPFESQNTPDKKTVAYPNPINRSNVLTVEVAGEHGELTIFLFNTVGKVIQTFNTSNKKFEINAPEVSGIYLLRVVEKQKVIAVEKIVVKE